MSSCLTYIWILTIVHFKATPVTRLLSQTVFFNLSLILHFGSPKLYNHQITILVTQGDWCKQLSRPLGNICPKSCRSGLHFSHQTPQSYWSTTAQTQYCLPYKMYPTQIKKKLKTSMASNFMNALAEGNERESAAISLLWMDNLNQNYAKHSQV